MAKNCGRISERRKRARENKKTCDENHFAITKQLLSNVSSTKHLQHGHNDTCHKKVVNFGITKKCINKMSNITDINEFSFGEKCLSWKSQ